ncbi:TetR/AcrR family transcriptional regulator [uncultured Marinobacter sp.]|uniref:TetR/AcrR family transcriptional regulator n=1 Tax=uncultured Marinobacter sp. TaxID=187379 RepID=UPI0030DA9155
MEADNKDNNPELTGSDQLTEAVVDGVQDTSLTELRRDQICEAALELFLKKGFASTTIRDICAQSGVNQASIYDYIANKNDILRRLLNKLWFSSDVVNLADRIVQHQDAPFEEQVTEYLRDSWTKKRKGTLLAYRAVPHLQEDDRRAMRIRDETVIHSLASQLRRMAKLADNDPRAEILANLIIFMAAFAPMRDWLHKNVDDEIILSTVAAGINAMVVHLAEQPNEPAEL